MAAGKSEEPYEKINKSLIYDTLVPVDLFIRFGINMQNCGPDFHFRFYD